MHDNYLHAQTRAVVANQRHFRESEKPEAGKLKDNYFESGLDLNLQRSGMLDEQYTVSNDETLRPTV